MRPQFDNFLAYCAQYVHHIQIETDPLLATSPDYIFHRDELAKNGYSISQPASDAKLVFQERIITALRDLLDNVVRQQNSKVDPSHIATPPSTPN